MRSAATRAPAEQPLSPTPAARLSPHRKPQSQITHAMVMSMDTSRATQESLQPQRKCPDKRTQNAMALQVHTSRATQESERPKGSALTSDRSIARLAKLMPQLANTTENGMPSHAPGLAHDPCVPRILRLRCCAPRGAQTTSQEPPGKNGLGRPRTHWGEVRTSGTTVVSAMPLRDWRQPQAPNCKDPHGSVTTRADNGSTSLDLSKTCHPR